MGGWTTGCCGGVGDTGEAVAVELVGGLGYGGGAGGHGLGVDGVAVGGVEVDEAAGGRVLGRQGMLRIPQPLCTAFLRLTTLATGVCSP